MNIDEAKMLAAKLKNVPDVVVLGVRTVEGERALVLRVKRRKLQVSNPENALGKIAKLTNIHGHRFVTINVCSQCYREGLQNTMDGHYHEVQREFSTTSAGAEPICCRCLKRNGVDCARAGFYRKAQRESAKKSRKTGKPRKTVGRR